MSNERWPSIANMASYEADPDTIIKRHDYILNYYQATDDDCALVNLKASPAWTKSKSEFQLEINSYLGWKCYMLHTGCLATIPEFEESK